jgi:hypothetical protein
VGPNGLNIASSFSFLFFSCSEVSNSSNGESSVVKTFKTMMGDSWVYEETLLPKTITEGIASDRFENIKDADYLTKKLKKAALFLLRLLISFSS